MLTITLKNSFRVVDNFCIIHMIQVKRLDFYLWAKRPSHKKVLLYGKAKTACLTSLKSFGLNASPAVKNLALIPTIICMYGSRKRSCF